MLARLSSKTLLLPAALAVGVILLLVLWLAPSDGDDAATLGPRGTPNPDLAFAICVQAVELTKDHEWHVMDPEISQDARRHMESAMAIAQQTPDWNPWQPGRNVQVDEGCPTLPALDYKAGQWLFGGGTLVDEPGFYNAFIFVVPDENLERLPFGIDPYHTSQEGTCSGDDCVDSAFALFIARSQVSDEEYIADMFPLLPA